MIHPVVYINELVLKGIIVPESDDDYFEAFDTNLTTERYLIVSHNVYIFKHRVMFGYRLQCASVEDYGTMMDINICCGIDPIAYYVMFAKVLILILNNPTDKPFKDIPSMSDIKPYMKDEAFIKTIDTLVDKIK